MKFFMSKNQIVYLIFILLLYGLIISSPWCYNYKYSHDLKAYASVLDTISRQTLVKSIFSNVFLFYFVKRVFVATDNYLLVNIIHNLGITFLLVVLVYYTNLKTTLTIIFIGFFSLFLGQIKEAIAIAFCIAALFESDKKGFKSYFFFLLALLCHFFAAFLFIIMYFLQKIIRDNYSNNLTKVLFLGFISIILLYFINENRYEYYFLIQKDSSFFFIVPLIICIVLRNELGKLNAFFLLLGFVSLITTSLYSFSNRLSEISGILIVIYHVYINKSENFIASKQINFFNFQISNTSIVLLFSGLIFFYRLFNIVVYEGVLRKYLIG